MSEERKLPSVDNKDFEFIKDHYEITKEDKKVAENILETIIEDSQKNIPHILQQGIYNDGKVKILSEVCCGDSVYDYYVLDFGKKVFKSRIDNYDWITHKFIDNDKLVN